jgi:hypothetical protein
MELAELNWIESAGGPLILLPLPDLLLWEGIRPPSGGRTVEANFRWKDKNDPATDYDRACDIRDLLGIVHMGQVEALVLGDEPLATAWLPDKGRSGGVVVRWRYAESDQSVASRQAEILAQEAAEPAVTLHVPSSPLLMFDSAVAGSDLEMTQALRIELQPGTYRVSSAEFNPDENTSLLLHRFELIGQEGTR